MGITTILFDLGGPLIDDDSGIEAWHEHLRRLLLERRGKTVTDAEIKTALSRAVECYAPSFISYIIWQLSKPDKNLFSELRAECDRFPFSDYFRIRPGARETLERLHGCFKLGLAANQRKSIREYLERENVLHFFDSTLVSEDLNFTKPDLRHFWEVLERLGSKPGEAMMIGDRQDNDIVPARLLGMTAVRVLVGLHRKQVVRYPREEADYEVSDTSSILSIPLISNSLRG
jgi:putative hydrolase of the HAD superfamily